MEYNDLTNLIKLINRSSLAEFKMKDGEFELSIRTDKYYKMKKEASASKHQQTIVPVQPPQMPPSMPQQPPQQATPQQPPQQAPPEKEEATSEAPPKKESTEETDEDLVPIKSPIVGTFYRAPAPDKSPYIKVGDHVDEGSVVCIVEAMKLFNEIESEVSGKVVKVVVDDASPVEYDQVLFLVDPEG